VMAAPELCRAQDLCGLTSGAVGFSLPSNPDAKSALDLIGRTAAIDTGNIRLRESSSELVRKKGGAAAQLCGPGGAERWIFFDPAYVRKISGAAGGSALPEFFVLAHETAHHASGHTMLNADWNKDQELSADHSAAVWLTRMGVKADELLATFNSLGLPSQPDNGYPSLCERRAKVIEGYNETRAPGEPAREVPKCDICSSQSPLRALYLRESVAPRVPLRQASVISCGVSKSSEDLPLDFNSDLTGMCTVVALPAGSRITWTNIDVCSLMRR